MNNTTKTTANLIGISGRKGVGKDMVGRIIQGLTTPDRVDREYYLHRLATNPDGSNYTPYNNPFKVVKFADKLKDMVCLLIGCTREQLEDREFKEKELGEEWWKYEIIWGECEPTELVDYNDERVELIKEGVFKPMVSRLVKPTPRLILQQLGTDCVRDILHPQAWVNATFAGYKPIGLYMVDVTRGLPSSGKDISNYPHWIITDMRFPNELEAVKSRGGVSIRVNRAATDNPTGTPHPSETALDQSDFDYTIDNNGTIADLVDKVRVILKDLNLI